MTTVELSPTPLPLKPPPYDEWKGNWPNHLRAYDRALSAERHADEQLATEPSNQEAKDHLMFARVAGYLLLELFNRRAILSDIPCESLVKRVISPPQDGDTLHDVVFGVGRWYFDRFLCRLWTPTDAPSYPTPESLRYSPPSFDTLAQMTKEHMKADGKDFRTSWRKVLVRDGFRCMLTGLYDEPSLYRNSELHQEYLRLHGMPIHLKACHILGESTTRAIDPENGEEGEVRSKTEHAMTILRDLGLGELAGEFLGADGIHDPGNILSLEWGSYIGFTNFDVWFEGTQEPNCYDVRVTYWGYEKHLRASKHLRDDCGRLSVTFRSNHADARLPNPKLLALHATCTRVAHMAGAIDALEDLDLNAETSDESESGSEWMGVPAFDDSPACLPDSLATPFATVLRVA